MPKAKQKLTFEQALERLEATVRQLESEQTGLDQSLALYEQGIELLKHCRAKLDQAEQKIRLLTGISEEGEAQTEPFDGTSTLQRQAAGSQGDQQPSDGQAEAADQQADEAERGLLF